MLKWIEKTKKIIEIINLGGGDARYVGGCVRDSLINKAVQDIDIATNILPNELVSLLNEHKIRNIPTGLKHGTITAIINNNSVEITTLRKDIKCDGRHADVCFTTDWIEDAKRRDFTFNALYCDVNHNIFDYFEGKKDLFNGELNFVGNPDDRITEDYLRILRVFRFHTAICVKPLSDLILDSCAKHAKNISILSGERIQSEMLKMLRYPNAINTIITMQQHSVLKEVMLEENFMLDKINNEFIKKITNPITKLAIIIRTNKNYKLLPDILLKHWKFSKRHYKDLLHLVLFENNILDPKIFILNHGKEFFMNIADIYLVENKITQKEYNNFYDIQNNWEIPNFPVNGQDIVDLGIKTGKDVGIVLNFLKDEWKSKEFLITREDLLKLVTQMIK